MKTNILIKKDYYFIVKSIESCKTLIQLNSCVNLIELFIEKHLSKVDLSFKGIEKYHNVNLRYRELKELFKRKKFNINQNPNAYDVVS